MNLNALLCKFSILVRGLELANIHTRVQQLTFDRTKLFTRAFLSWKPKNLFNLISAFNWFAADLQIRFTGADPAFVIRGGPNSETNQKGQFFSNHSVSHS